MMRHYRYHYAYYCIAFLLLTSGCRHEDYVRDYPQLLSIELKSNTTSGITVEATMGGIHTDQVINHGFVWSTTLKDLVLSAPDGPGMTGKSYAVLLGKPAGNVFSADIDSRLTSKTKYFIRAFIQTGTTTVYGAPVAFTSAGSDGATITGISPAAIVPGGVVTITGKRFGTDAQEVKVWMEFNVGSLTLAIQTINDTVITASVPKAITYNSGTIYLSKSGEEGLPHSKLLPVRLPTLTSLNATDVCSTFQLNGTDLLLLGQPTKVVVNNKSLVPLPTVTNTSITIPAWEHAHNIVVEVYYDASSSYSFTGTFADPVAMPVVTNMPSKYSGDSFIVTGTNFPACDGFGFTMVYTPNVTLSISNVTPTQFTVTMTGNPCEIEFVLTFHDKVLSEPVLTRQASTITSVSPLSGKIGDHITVTGTNLDEVSAHLSSNGFFPDRILEAFGTPTQLDVVIAAPEDYDLITFPSGDLSLYFQECSNPASYYTFHLDTPPITVTDVSPAVSDGTQGLTVTGTNFLSDADITVNLLTPGGQQILSIRPGTAATDTTMTFPSLRNYTSYTGMVVVTIVSYGRTITYGTQIQLQ